MPRLAALAQGASLFQVGQKITATALLNANFALFNNWNSGQPLILVSAKVQASAVMEVSLLTLDTDPAMPAGNTPANLFLGSRKAQATFEAQALAAPASARTLSVVEASNNNTVELVDPGCIFIPRNNGVMISSALVAGDCVVTLLWAELDAMFTDALYEAE